MIVGELFSVRRRLQRVHHQEGRLRRGHHDPERVHVHRLDRLQRPRASVSTTFGRQVGKFGAFLGRKFEGKKNLVAARQEVFTQEVLTKKFLIFNNIETGRHKWPNLTTQEFSISFYN